LLGQNVLNSFQSEIFVGYNGKQYKTIDGFTYGGLFPFINIGAHTELTAMVISMAQNILNELCYLGLSVPLNLTAADG
jgi:hypothetical protein